AKTLYYVFIFPIRLVTILIIIRAFLDKSMPLLKNQKIGLAILLADTILGGLVNAFNYYGMMHLPPQFWFLPVSGYSIGYIWEFVNALLLIFGFLLITKENKNI
ncbi:MAG: hypothetical protein ACPLKV_03280, partial [Minisyncoccia bacterium]